MLTLLAMAAGLLLGVVTGPVLGWRRAPQYRNGWLRRWWLLPIGVALTTVADRVSTAWLAQVMLVVGYAALVAFAVANRRMAGMGIVAVGLLLNAAVVTLDGGMPVRPAAVVDAGLAGPGGRVTAPSGHRHHLQRAGDRLTALDDAIAFPAVGQVVSVGDLVLLVGLAEVAAYLVPTGPVTVAAIVRARRRAPSSSRRAQPEPAPAGVRAPAASGPFDSGSIAGTGAFAAGPGAVAAGRSTAGTGPVDWAGPGEDTAGRRYPPAVPPQVEQLEEVEPLPPLVAPTLR